MLSGISIATTIGDLAGGFSGLFLPIAGGLLVLLLLVTLIDRKIKGNLDHYANYWLLIPHIVIPAGIAFAAIAKLGIVGVADLVQPLAASSLIFFAAIIGGVAAWLIFLFIGAYIKCYPVSLILVLVADAALALSLLLGLSVEFVTFAQV